MTVKHLIIPRGGAYTAPSSEVVEIDASCQLMNNSFTIPDVTEETLEWD